MKHKEILQRINTILFFQVLVLRRLKTMQKSRLYIFQAISILVLICGYFISDQPDSWSVMHFDLTKANTIAPVDSRSTSANYVTTLSQYAGSSKKMNTNKDFSYKVIIPRTSIIFHYCAEIRTVYATPFQEKYFYLFFREINPPPPKFC